MKIVVNTRLLLNEKLEGIGWFTYQTLKRITQKHSDHDFIFVFDRQYDQKFVFSDNVTPVVIKPVTRHPFLWLIWFEISLHRFLKKTKPDLFLSPDGYLSLQSNVISLPVVHDINFHHFPEQLPWIYSKYYNYFFPKYCKKAKRIATVSAYSKNDISENYHINRKNIDVVYNGSHELYKPILESKKQEIKKKYTNTNEYFIYIGSLHSRKNINRMLLAFDQFKSKDQDDLKLLIIGEKLFRSKKISDIYQNLKYKNDILFLGRKEPEELALLLASAKALLFVPLFEGFGIPVVEAMNCSVPVICSNVSSLPEVAGKAACYVDPYKPESIVEGMQKVAYNKEYRIKLIEEGNQQKQKFSWEQTADKLWQSIEKCLN